MVDSPVVNKMEDVVEGNAEDRDRRSSGVSVGNSINQASPSAVKEIQVTAKEIVDRISSFQSSSMDLGGVFDDKQGKPTGYVKPFTGGSDPANSSGDEKGPEDPKSPNPALSNSSTPPSASSTTAVAASQTERSRKLSSKSSRFSVSSMTSENGSSPGPMTIEQRAVEHLLDVVQVS